MSNAIQDAPAMRTPRVKNNNVIVPVGKRQRKESPKYVDEGSYGCVMAPAMSCTEGENLNTSSVSKLYSANAKGLGLKEAMEEYKSNNIVAAIDPKRIFSLKTSRACEVSSSRFDPEELGKCTMFSDLKTMKNLPMLVIENGGVTMTKLIQQHGLVHLKKQDPNVMIAGLWRLFHGIKVMAEYGLVHQDIKNDNILVSDEKVTFIDFGLMSKYWHNHYMFVPRAFLMSAYEIFPPEYNFMEVAYMKGSGLDPREVMKSSFNRIREIMIKMASRIKNVSIRYYIRNFFRELENLYRIQNEEVTAICYNRIDMGVNRTSARKCSIADRNCKVLPPVLALAKYYGQYVDRIDVYSLGIVVMKLVVTFAIADTVSLGWVEMYMSQLVIHMVHPDPKQRCDASTAMTLFKRLVGPLVRKNSNANVQQTGR